MSLSSAQEAALQWLAGDFLYDSTENTSSPSALLEGMVRLIAMRSSVRSRISSSKSLSSVSSAFERPFAVWAYLRALKTQLGGLEGNGCGDKGCAQFVDAVFDDSFGGKSPIQPMTARGCRHWEFSVLVIRAVMGPSSGEVGPSSELGTSIEGASGEGGCSLSVEAGTSLSEAASSELSTTSEGACGERALSVEAGTSLSEEPSGESSDENPRRTGGTSLSDEFPLESGAAVDGLSGSLEYTGMHFQSWDGVVYTGKSSAIAPIGGRIGERVVTSR